MSETNGQVLTVKKVAKTSIGYTLHTPNGKFAKGNPGGPGRPKGKRDFFAELIRDLERVEASERKSFLRHRWQRAFKNDSVAADMMAYLLPKPKPADHTEPPAIHFHGPAQVAVAPSQSISFQGPPSNGHPSASTP